MNLYLYSTIVSLHVVTVILGLGPLTALAIATSRPRPDSFSLERTAQLLRIVGWSLLGVLVTGAAIIALTHGALGETGWMRVSFLLFLFLGALHGLARRTLRRMERAAPAPLPGKSLHRIAWAMCGLVIAITYLMEAKPF